MRVLLVQNHQLTPGTSTAWRQVQSEGVDLHVVDAVSGALATSSSHGLRNIHPLRVHRLRGQNRTGDWYEGLGQLMSEVAPDVVHVWSEPWSLASFQALRAHQTVIIHGAETRFSGAGRPTRPLRRLMLAFASRRAAGYAAWSHVGLDAAGPYFDHIPTAAIPPAIPDPSGFVTDRKKAWADRGMGPELALGFVGTLVYEKGPDLLISAVRGLKNRPMRLHVFGDGALRDYLTRLASVDGRIVFHGRIEHSEIPTIMAALDLLVVPTRDLPHSSEQFGRVVTEAMYAGTPVLGSSSGALPEVIGPGGFIFQANSVSSLQSSLNDILADRDRLTMIGQAGHASAVKRFSPSRCSSVLRDLWSDVTT